MHLAPQLSQCPTCLTGHFPEVACGLLSTCWSAAAAHIKACHLPQYCKGNPCCSHLVGCQSALPEASHLPQWEKRTTLTVLMLSVSVASCLGADSKSCSLALRRGLRLQILILLSEPQVAKRWPLGWQAME